MSNSLNPDQARHSVGPDLGPNCLKRLSADNRNAVYRSIETRRRLTQTIRFDYRLTGVYIFYIFFSTIFNEIIKDSSAALHIDFFFYHFIWGTCLIHVVGVGRGLEAVLQSHPQLSQHTVSGLNYSSNTDVDVTINAFPDSLSACVGLGWSCCKSIEAPAMKSNK